MRLNLTKEEKSWLRKNYRNFTNKEIFDYINAQRSPECRFERTTLRMRIYELGLKKCNILRWTESETEFLLQHYKDYGNKWIARKLSTKDRPFTGNNVTKKMGLLGLKRTREQLQTITENHKKRGTYHQANLEKWKTRKIKEGETVTREAQGRVVVFIKFDGHLTAYARHRYQQLHGALETNEKVYFKDMNPLNVADDNLIMCKGRGLTTAERNTYKAHCDAWRQEQQEADYSYAQQAEKPAPPPPAVTKRIPVRVDRKTTIYILPGQNAQEAINKYKNRNL